MNPIFLDLGFIQIYWYSIMILLGIILGGFAIFKESTRFKINKDFILNLFFYTIPIAIIGARIYFVMFHFDYYSKNFIEIFKIWEGGLAIHGAIIAGLIFIIYYCRKYKQDIWHILDITVIGLIIGQIIGRWGNFFNQEAYGPVTSLTFLKNLYLPQFIIDGMYINGAYHHPTFLYESLWNLLGVAFLTLLRRFKNIKVGQLTCIYLIWYGIGRFLIEVLRQDSLMLGNLKIAQVVSLFMIIIGLILLIYFSKVSKKFYNEEK